MTKEEKDLKITAVKTNTARVEMKRKRNAQKS
jgi:hypothetical protein